MKEQQLVVRQAHSSNTEYYRNHYFETGPEGPELED